MPHRPDINKVSSPYDSHDNRFNYFDKIKVSGSSKNVPVKMFEFQKSIGRKREVFPPAGGKEPAPLSLEDIKAMRQ
jgi:hypothetical protein